MQHRQRFDAGGRFDRGEPVALDDARESVPHRAFVVHDQTTGLRSRSRLIAPVEGNRGGARRFNGAKRLPPAAAGRYASGTSTRAAPMTRILPHDDEHGFATRSVHAGQVIEPLAGAVMTPIYQTSTYVQEGLGQPPGLRVRPDPEPDPRGAGAQRRQPGRRAARLRLRLRTRRARRRAQAPPEPATTSSAGTTSTAAPSGSWSGSMPGSGSSSPSWTCARSGNVERALTPATRMVYCETPTNPMMNLVDLAAVGDLTQAHGYLFAVDNTFATPFFQRPLELRRGHRAPLHDQVPQRAQRHGGRPAGDGRETTWPSGWASSRTRRARCPARWTAGWPSAASRPCRSGCGSTMPTAAASRSGSRDGRTSRRSTTPDCRPTPSTSWPAGR